MTSQFLLQIMECGQCDEVRIERMETGTFILRQGIEGSVTEQILEVNLDQARLLSMALGHLTRAI
jgi:hypothetical protein